MGTLLELNGNELGTKKSNNPTSPPQERKKRGPPGGMLPHLIGWNKCFWPTCVILPFGGMNYGCILGMGPTPGTHYLAGSSSEGP
jgi:hypothetical protein